MGRENCIRFRDMECPVSSLEINIDVFILIPPRIFRESWVSSTSEPTFRVQWNDSNAMCQTKLFPDGIYI